MYEVLRGVCRCEGVVTDLCGAGDVPPGCDLGAMADVDRRLRGRGPVEFVRLWDDAEEDAGVDGTFSCCFGVLEWPLP